MQTFSFYSHYLGTETIVDLLKKYYPHAEFQSEEGDGNIRISAKTSHIQINYRQRKQPSYQLSDKKTPFLNNLRGLYGFITQIPMQNQALQEKLLHKIATINSEFSLSIDETNSEDLLRELAEAYDAILFLNGANPLNKEIQPHFLNSGLQLISNTAGKTEVDDLLVRIENKYLDTSDHKEEAIERKGRTEEILKEMSVKLNLNLPPIAAETETTTRTRQEIAKRVSALAICNFVAFDHLGGNQAKDYLKTHGLLNILSPKEQDFLKNPNTLCKRQETWKSECIWVLLWALNKVDGLGSPANLCDLDLVADEDYPVGPTKDPNTFIETAKSMRSTKEILDANDYYYRLHWAVVDARLQQTTVDGVHPSVVYERHYALNWLINYRNQTWDEVNCDT